MLHLEDLTDRLDAGEILLYGHNHSLDLTIKRLQEYSKGYSFFRVSDQTTCDYYYDHVTNEHVENLRSRFNNSHCLKRSMMQVLNEIVVAYNEKGNSRLGTVDIPGHSIILFENMDQELNNPEVQTKIQELSEDANFQTFGVHLFFYSHSPTENRFLIKHGTEVEIPNLTEQEITRDFDDLKEFSKLLVGMPPHEITTAWSWSVNTNASPKEIEAFIREKRTRVISQSPLLKFLPEDMKVKEHEIGGYDKCITYLKNLGTFMKLPDVNPLDVPRGVAFVGLPGTGKSYLAKAVGGLLGLETVCLDLTAAYRPLVGQSEEAIRDALSVVNDVGRCVLYLDEIDKMGAGNKCSNGDSGTAARVMGIFLSWLQDNRSGAFVVMTMNDMDALSPEFMRDGRFDRVFRVCLPSPEERIAILKCQYARRGRIFCDMDPKVHNKIIRATRFFTGAEIEQTLKDAILETCVNGRELTIEDFIEKASDKKPLVLAQSELVRTRYTGGYWYLTNASSVENKEFSDFLFPCIDD